ncbi:MAG: EAL domain-containing protein, partial [Acidimicrobiales bacterium]
LVDTLRREGVPPEALVVEVSERSMLDGATTGASTGIVTALHSLSGAGILVALDDFGTGYSSLTHVVSYPLDCLKIDRSFVAGLGSDTHRSSVVAALVGLAGATHMEVVAEGVEHPRQVETLRELGCRFGQGYHFSRPAPLEETIMACRLAAGVTSTSDDPPPASDDLTQRSD